MIMEKIINFYCEDEQRELKKLVYPMIIKYKGISQKDYDDFYSLAALTLWQATMTYDKAREIPFEKYLQNCLAKKFHSMMCKKIH